MEWLENIMPEVITFFSTAGITWIFARKKNAADVESVELDNVEKAVAIWRSLATDLRAEISSLKAEVEELRNQQACPDCPHINK